MNPHGTLIMYVCHTLIGIDTQMFSVGPDFKGIKMIPPGPHFVYYSSSTRDGKEFSPIIGFFVDAGPSEVIVRKWDQQEERLVKVPEEEEERYCQAVRSLEFDRHLGPYNLSQYGDWKQLSNYITKSIIQRIEPIGGEITVASESTMRVNTPSTMMEKALDEQLNSSRHKLLESVLLEDYGGSEDLLLAELQFAYIAFLMGQSLEAFLQWKSLVSLLFGCTEAPFRTRSRLFAKFIRVIYYQLKQGLQKDCSDTNSGSTLLDDSWFSADSFLHRLFKDFFLLVQDASVVDGDLLSWTRKLKELLENNLGWEFQQNSAVDGMYFEDDDEFAPVVEMLDDPSSSVAPSV
ncbi:hypothetical protein Pyn_17673 [Prunus yedoensis var. nudiflora]|uniref:Protein AAR2 homolog n=1 Tax=Prunus yedoensis var. nudiflora TaxID=2094558 RepID=A0A314UZR3_PRUYE|nr:hypothetical protein Pyn_17673 [Prunus yedoensis var. nudiflora]